MAFSTNISLYFENSKPTRHDHIVAIEMNRNLYAMTAMSSGAIALEGLSDP